MCACTCSVCGYDLEGVPALPGSRLRCPECGTVQQPDAPAAGEGRVLVRACLRALAVGAAPVLFMLVRAGNNHGWEQLNYLYYGVPTAIGAAGLAAFLLSAGAEALRILCAPARKDKEIRFHMVLVPAIAAVMVDGGLAFVGAFVVALNSGGGC